jgi:hypothetical protein
LVRAARVAHSGRSELSSNHAGGRQPMGLR